MVTGWRGRGFRPLRTGRMRRGKRRGPVVPEGQSTHLCFTVCPGAERCRPPAAAGRRSGRLRIPRRPSGCGRTDASPPFPFKLRAARHQTALDASTASETESAAAPGPEIEVLTDRRVCRRPNRGEEGLPLGAGTGPDPPTYDRPGPGAFPTGGPPAGKPRRRPSYGRDRRRLTRPRPTRPVASVA